MRGGAGGQRGRGEKRIRNLLRTCAPLLLCCLFFSAGCSYIFSEKRTVYQYEPTYGVDSPDFRRSLEVLGTELAPSNRATLLKNGDETFASLLTAFREARRSINIELYIFNDGKVGTEFARVLAERARQGVEVRLLVDGFGSSLGKLEEEMEAAGARVEIYKPLRIYSLDRIGNRTHRRIVTVDGQVGFCGGFAVDDRWLGNARDPSEWRDTNIRVEGPVVAQLQHVFLEDWVHTTGEVLHGPNQFPPIEPAGHILAQAVSSARSDQSSMAKLQYYMGIQAARKTIWIENAYFVPDRQIRQGLVAAAGRGVDVRVIVPGKYIDSPNVRLASRFHYGELLDGGVQIYEYLPTMMHNKVMVVDGIWTSIGSINFVNRSMTKNGEANLSVYDRGFAAEVEKMIEEDLTNCEVFTKEKWNKRGFWARFGETFFWLFSENY
ncbi:MAG TPA: phospholipase D-like domain-containing protein [Thermoanaerobaculia bacterium]|nr:phospholipase D-like domain-containing protein [Thermoanaerobaculia bacterium]